MHKFVKETLCLLGFVLHLDQTTSSSTSNVFHLSLEPNKALWEKATKRDITSPHHHQRVEPQQNYTTKMRLLNSAPGLLLSTASLASTSYLPSTTNTTTIASTSTLLAPEPHLLPRVARAPNTVGVYYCTTAPWTGTCKNNLYTIGGCYNWGLPFAGTISSIGPDKGFVCSLFKSADCDMAAGVKQMVYPGFANLADLGWGEKPRSIRCRAGGLTEDHAPPAMSSGAVSRAILQLLGPALQPLGPVLQHRGPVQQPLGPVLQPLEPVPRRLGVLQPLGPVPQHPGPVHHPTP
ncbi:hypothetical protein K402DRAFT_148672 [Aulographum hederae CBS 113979]|uniref:Uncharacterized protein n=1 Tax=Aulographum hederae CBS 113979 TaxID=1176131 RepID=A0A6G1GU78_9PEZI|nr:hypothetical protein K402DRAFT_148672 [Aulographum hederae CBS 113979]